MNKCSLISCGRKVNRIQFAYRTNGIVLERCSQIDVFGVIIGQILPSASHIDRICKDASTMFGFIKKDTRFLLNIECLKIVFIAYARLL